MDNIELNDDELELKDEDEEQEPELNFNNFVIALKSLAYEIIECNNERSLRVMEVLHRFINSWPAIPYHIQDT